MNILFLGSGAFGLPSLQALAQSSHSVLAVFSQPDRPAGRGQKLSPTPISQWALQENRPLFRVQDINAPEVIAQVQALHPDLLVVIAFGQKLSPQLLACARLGGINLHSSLLPKFRGAAPINWALLRHEPITGVSVLQVTQVMDGGDLLGNAATPIGPAETAGELHDRLAELGAPLLVQIVEAMARGELPREIQDPAAKSSAPKLARPMAWVDFEVSSHWVSDRIRGLSPWPGVAVEIFDEQGKSRLQATILKCQAAPSDAIHPPERCGMVLANRHVACGRGELELLELQPLGRKAMPLAAFVNGYGLAAGFRLKSLQIPPPGEAR